MSRKYLLDSSFVIDLLNEIARDRPGPAAGWLRDNPRAVLMQAMVLGHDRGLARLGAAYEDFRQVKPA